MGWRKIHQKENKKENRDCSGTISKANHINWENIYHVIPINFQKESRPMLSNLKMLVDSNCIQVHPSMTNLITSLRTAYDSGSFELDKTKSLHNDLLDCLRLACRDFHAKMNEKTEEYMAADNTAASSFTISKIMDRKPAGLIENKIEYQDMEDLAGLVGYRPRSVRLINSRDFIPGRDYIP